MSTFTGETYVKLKNESGRGQELEGQQLGRTQLLVYLEHKVCHEHAFSLLLACLSFVSLFFYLF
jgi:hypothetical protein